MAVYASVLHSNISRAVKTVIKAHHIQTQLLSTEAAGEHLSVDVLLVHAQDHLMCSMLAQELVQELICLYERTATKNA